MEMTARLIANPARLVAAQLGFWQDYMTLWQNTARRVMGMETEPVIDAPAKFELQTWSLPSITTAHDPQEPPA